MDPTIYIEPDEDEQEQPVEENPGATDEIIEAPSSGSKPGAGDEITLLTPKNEVRTKLEKLSNMTKHNIFVY